MAVFGLAFGSISTPEVSADSNIYYVSTVGSDTNSGTFSAPFKTFARAVSVLRPGDTLHAQAGTYYESLTLSTSGTESAPITVIGNGATLNMEGAKANGIAISGNHVRVSKFEVIGARDFGIVVTSKNVLVENNIIHDNVTRNGVGTCGLSTSWGSGLKVRVGGENITIRNNTIYNNCGEGIAVTRGITALIENNTVFDNFGVNIYVDNSPYVTIQNNLSYCMGTHLWNGNRAVGIGLGEELYTSWGAQRHDILIVGNTIMDCSTGVAAFESDVSGTLTNVTITNNRVPSGQDRSISLYTLLNRNISVSNNGVFNAIYVYQTAGVTLNNNAISTMTCNPEVEECPIFADVLRTHPYVTEIEALYTAGLTGGCGTNPLLFCPHLYMSRAQIAVFTMRAEFGIDYTPPLPPYLFRDDWSQSPWGESWANGMFQAGLTAGCNVALKLFCPESLSTRGEIAVFGLRLKYGRAYNPPPARGTIFADLTDVNHWATAWAEQAYAEGLIPDCGLDGASGKPMFCNYELVTRGFGASVIAKAKGLVP